MKSIFRSYTKGQSLIFFVFISVVLIGILAFALDMGYVYYMRRWAQNSADSAALAGARELCITSLEPDDLDGRLAIADVAGKYYAEERNLATNFAENSANISLLSAYEVEATVTITHPTIVASFFGQESLVVPAIAAAGCFEPAGANTIPVSWKCRREDPDDPCDMQYEDDDGCSLGDDFYYVFLWADGDDDQIFFCENWPGNPETPGPKQEILDCDYDNISEEYPDDIEVVSPLDDDHSWSWVNLIENGQGDANELVDVVNGGSPTSVTPPVWVYDASGEKTTIYGAIISLLNLGRHDFQIPVYDAVCEHAEIEGATGDPQHDCPSLFQEGDNIIPKAAVKKKSFRIVSFAILDIQCSEWGGDSCPGRNFLNSEGQISASIKSIEGCFKQGVVSGPGGHGGGGISPAGAYTIYLTR